MKRFSTSLATLSLLVVGGTAFGQQTARSLGRSTQLASSPASASVVKAPAATAPQPTVAAAGTPLQQATKATLPSNLFSTNDNAIIIVGGKPTKVLDVKNEINAEFLRGSGAPQIGKSASRATPAPRVETVATDPAGKARQKIVSCEKDKLPPTIDHIVGPPVAFSVRRGSLRSNSLFTIVGDCFGQDVGSIEIVGPSPIGNLTIAAHRWTEDRVVAIMPRERNVTDTMVALTLVSRDGARSAPKEVFFEAEKALVAVPAKSFTPASTLEHTDTVEVFNTLFSLSRNIIGSALVTFSTPLTVRIDPACRLDQLTWTSRVGSVVAVNGWDTGSADHVDLTVQWTPRVITETTNYVFSSETKQTARVAIDFAATAWCPIGMTP